MNVFLISEEKILIKYSIKGKIKRINGRWCIYIKLCREFYRFKYISSCKTRVINFDWVHIKCLYSSTEQSIKYRYWCTEGNAIPNIDNVKLKILNINRFVKVCFFSHSNFGRYFFLQHIKNFNNVVKITKEKKIKCLKVFIFYWGYYFDFKVFTLNYVLHQIIQTE